jgi:hypothetical protein
MIIPNNKTIFLLAHQFLVGSEKKPEQSDQRPPIDIPYLVCPLNEKENTMQIYRFFK